MGNGNTPPQSSYAVQSLGQSAKGGGVTSPQQTYSPPVMPQQPMMGDYSPPVMPQQPMMGVMPTPGQPMPMASQPMALSPAQLQMLQQAQRQQAATQQATRPYAPMRPLMQPQVIPAQMQPQPYGNFFGQRLQQNPYLQNGIGAFNYFR